MTPVPRAPLVGAADELADASAEGPARRVLFDGERMRAVLLRLQPGQEIPIHAPGLDLVLSVLQGVGRIVAGDSDRWVRAGDVAVIPAGARRGIRAEATGLVTLNVVSPPPVAGDHDAAGGDEWPDVEPGADVAALIQAEHAGLREKIGRLGALAAASPLLDEDRARAELEAVVRFLREDLLPHAAEEERSVYPAVDRVLRAVGGGTRTMSADHAQITTLVERLERLAGQSADEPAAGSMRRLLYGLEALLELHFRKEEEVYLPLLALLSPGESSSLYAHLTGSGPAEEA